MHATSLQALFDIRRVLGDEAAERPNATWSGFLSQALLSFFKGLDVFKRVSTGKYSAIGLMKLTR